MNIGIVTVWFERGAAYVSRIYKELLESEGHKVFIFARGGEVNSSSISEDWCGENVTRSTKYVDTTIQKRKFYKWIKVNGIEAILFNEQQDFRILPLVKEKFPDVKLGAYVDYYTEYSLKWFDMYDFLICNTKRHMQAMQAHPQKYYVRWGTNIKVYRPSTEEHERVTFFHSVGMSYRKGTEVLINAFINGKLYNESALVIHTQIPIEKNCQYTKEQLKEYNIEVIEKTVSAPGLYYLGDVYVYPTRLDGLGLTMYEALSSGMPIIVSDFPPMNELGTDEFVKRVKIRDYYCRGDAYYYPMVICDEISLIASMKWYVKHTEKLKEQKVLARKYPEQFYDISKQSKLVSNIFYEAKIRPLDKQLAKEVKQSYMKNFNVFKVLLKLRCIYNARHK